MAELPVLVAAAAGGLAAGALVNYALWRGSPDPANLAVWQQATPGATEQSRGRTLVTLGLLIVMIGGGAVLAVGVEAVAGVPTAPAVLGLVAVAFAAGGVLDAAEGRARDGAFYLVAALLWTTFALDWALALDRAVVTAAACAALGYVLLDVLDAGMPGTTPVR